MLTLETDSKMQNWLEEHLRYEWMMLRHTISRMQKPGTDQADWNAFYESFTIHARSLYDFLTNDNSNSSFNAEDFVAGFGVRKTNLTNGIFQKLNSQVLHLNKRRALDNKVTLQDSEELFEWLERELMGFVERLPNSMRPLLANKNQALVQIPPRSRPSASAQPTSVTSSVTANVSTGSIKSP